ncbi:HEAT repeat domain-containing protein [Thiolapillus sp.]
MNNPPDTLLLIAPGCPHCQSVLGSLAELIKQGDIGRLEVVNIAVHPEAARQAGTRSVPWMRIGHYELAGNYSLGEIRKWAEKAASGDSSADYIRELLEQQQMDEAIRYLRDHPEQLPELLKLMQREDNSLGVSFGVSALFEEMAGSEALRQLAPELGALTRSEKANIRGDAAYYLGLSANPEAREWLQPLLDDPQADVREIAREALENLSS